MDVHAGSGRDVASRFPAFAEAVRLADDVAAFNEDTTLGLEQREALTIEDRGELRGLALSRVLDEGGIEAELAVHPEARGRGLGTALLSVLQGTAKESHDGKLRVWAHGNLPGAQQLAARRGLAPTRTLYQLELPLADDYPKPEFTEGERIRTFDRHTDGEDWVALNAKVFADHPEQGGLRIADLDSRIQQDWFDAEDFLILEAATGEMLGYNWLKITPDEAEIYVIGVAPKAAGRGYGTALMNAGLQRLRDRGANTAVLYVDGVNERAVALYRRLGFTDRTVDVQYAADPQATANR